MTTCNKVIFGTGIVVRNGAGETVHSPYFRAYYPMARPGEQVAAAPVGFDTVGTLSVRMRWHEARARMRFMRSPASSPAGWTSRSGRRAVDLYGKIALVAGATRGCGRAIAIELAKASIYVYATGRSSRSAGRSEINRPETIEETGDMIAAAGRKGQAIRSIIWTPARCLRWSRALTASRGGWISWSTISAATSTWNGTRSSGSRA